MTVSTIKVEPKITLLRCVWARYSFYLRWRVKWWKSNQMECERSVWVGCHNQRSVNVKPVHLRRNPLHPQHKPEATRLANLLLIYPCFFLAHITYVEDVWESGGLTRISTGEVCLLLVESRFVCLCISESSHLDLWTAADATHLKCFCEVGKAWAAELEALMLEMYFLRARKVSLTRPAAPQMMPLLLQPWHFLTIAIFGKLFVPLA